VKMERIKPKKITDPKTVVREIVFILIDVEDKDVFYWRSVPINMERKGERKAFLNSIMVFILGFNDPS
jgi:hypothetical protein